MDLDGRAKIVYVKRDHHQVACGVAKNWCDEVVCFVAECTEKKPWEEREKS